MADIVVIRSGVITASPFASEIGQHQYFVDVLESDGGEIGMWSGVSYYNAVLAAHELAAEWGEDVAVTDLTEPVLQ
jgi:hypothetical protein